MKRKDINQQAFFELLRAGLVSEWKAFGALAIEHLGFPKDLCCSLM